MNWKIQQSSYVKDVCKYIVHQIEGTLIPIQQWLFIKKMDNIKNHWHYCELNGKVQQQMA